MNMRTRSPWAALRSSRTPQYRASTGKVTAAIPRAPWASTEIPRPTTPAASNHSASTDIRAKTTRPMPRASRAQGARCWRTVVRWRRRRVLGGRRVDLRLALAIYTSMITGRITGLRWVTS
jgi:hypothetical protein